MASTGYRAIKQRVVAERHGGAATICKTADKEGEKQNGSSNRTELSPDNHSPLPHKDRQTENASHACRRRVPSPSSVQRPSSESISTAAALRQRVVASRAFHIIPGTQHVATRDDAEDRHIRQLARGRGKSGCRNYTVPPGLSHALCSSSQAWRVHPLRHSSR